ncbi:MAG: FliH/SctL family protein [Pirellulales bacterium]|nr:FliH/SctL family protein [Pirellulales bacterium]
MSTVIKSGTGRAVQRMAFNLDDLSQQAQTYLEQVRVQAAQIVVEAQKQAELLKSRAQTEGQNAARVAAEKILDEKISHKLEHLLPALRQVIAELADEKQSWLRHWEATAVTLAAKIAEKLLRAELTQQPDLPVKLVREALDMATGATQIRILLNPQDHAALGPQISQITGEFRRIAQAEIVPDPAISAGGCRILTQHGMIDQTISAQLERIISELTGQNES